MFRGSLHCGAHERIASGLPAAAVAAFASPAALGVAPVPLTTRQRWRLAALSARLRSQHRCRSKEFPAMLTTCFDDAPVCPFFS